MSPIVTERRVLEVLGHSAGGTARHVAQIVAGLHGRDGLSLDLAGPADWTVEMPRPVYAVAVPDGVTGHRSAIRALRDLALLGRYDAVHAHGLRAGIDCGLALRGRLPLFVSVHNVLRPDVSGRPRYALLGWTEGLLMVLATHVFTASAEIARALSRRAPLHSRKLEVLHLGVDETPPVRRSAAEVRAELEVAPGDALVVTAARLAPQKALHVMLAALSRLEDRVVLAVLGEGPLEEDLRAHAGRLGVGGRVRWLGWRDDVADFLAAANAFCLSSNWEACALAAQEAMRLGTVVVSTDVGGMPELVIDGSTGCLVPKGDDAALARALATVLGSDELREQLRDGARRHLAQSFSSARMLDRLAEAYLE